MTWRQEKLPEIVRQLARRPKHEALRGHIIDILTEAFGARYEEISHERFLLDRSGRTDVLWGATVIELKSNLDREIGDVLARMPDYLADAQKRARSARPVTGIATDGPTFISYAMQNGALAELARFRINPDRPGELLAWLELVVSEREDLLPEADTIVQAFGRPSTLFNRARLALEHLWAALESHPEVKLKQELWTGLLREAYGADVGGNALFQPPDQTFTPDIESVRHRARRRQGRGWRRAGSAGGLRPSLTSPPRGGPLNLRSRRRNGPVQSNKGTA